MCMCMSACGYVHECWNLWRPEAVRFSGTGVTNSHNLFDVGAGHRILLFWKSSMNSLLLSHFSAQQVTLNRCRV